MFKKTGLFLASIAPGIFMVGYNIGTGGITLFTTLMAVAGVIGILNLLT